MNFITTLFIALLFVIQAQSHQLILKVNGSPSRTDISRSLQNYNLSRYTVLSGEFRLLLVDVPNVIKRQSLSQVMQGLQADPLFQYVTYDSKIKKRQLDPGSAVADNIVSQLWSLKDKRFSNSAIKAWKEFGLGGRDISRQDIVVAVIDGGVQVNHPAIAKNAWVNRREIPNNGIDDDQNGYVDDIFGWNPGTESGAIRPDPHGTHVAGVIAGNDSRTGFKGIAPHTKVMTVDYSSGEFISTVVKAYTYVYRQKKLWFQSVRRKGANIVATNSSFGADGARCGAPEFDLWADMYDRMGRLGIVSVAATTNGTGIDVDRIGDVPTTCRSQFLLAVGNVAENGHRLGGHGRRSVDLFAQGTNIVSADMFTNGYIADTGTSFATPQVAGGVAYLYSIAGQDFQKSYRVQPAKAALFLKEVIMRGALPGQHLARRSVTGGYFNLYRSAKLLQQYSQQNRRQNIFLNESNSLEELLLEEPLSL